MMPLLFGETLVVLLSLSDFVQSVAISNGVIGTPMIHCKEDQLSIVVRTQTLFTGNVFVKGKSGNQDCSKTFQKSNADGANFTISLGKCGMQRLRSVNPKGMNFIIIVIVSFHPIFITKVDRAYNVRCFYMEPEKTVAIGLDVSMLTTNNLYDTMTMPTCTYSVRLKSNEGPVAKYVNVGDALFHVWECTGADMGLMVKRCYANDGNGQQVVVVNYDGCAVDNVLVGQLTYDPGLMRAYAETHAFKYADSNSLFFNCEIKLCQKLLGLCKGITPPDCNKTTPLTYAPPTEAREKRAVHTEELSLDVTTPELLILDLDQKQFGPDNLVPLLQPQQLDSTTVDQTPVHYSKENVCVPTGIATLFVLGMMALTVASGVGSVLIYRCRERRYLISSRSSAESIDKC